MTLMAEDATTTKRGYDLRKRLENMDQTRQLVLHAARRQLESEGYRQVTMASLAAESGVTRQTIHNLFGSKSNVLETLFDSLAFDGGMERMRDVMQQRDPQAMLQAFVHLFCDFWKDNRALFRRIHGIGSIDPDLGAILQTRNQRRDGIAHRITKQYKIGREVAVTAATLSALTSFEFYDALILSGQSEEEAKATIFKLASHALV
ncbi:MAG TPA: TetR/AcrR family transcriptional regulator [Acidobacteriaceae bacterium]